MPGIVKNYYKKEKCSFDERELNFLKCSRLVRLQDLEIKNVSNMIHENIIDKENILSTFKDMLLINKVLLEKLIKKNE